ncbi:phage portal protein [Flavobacterium algicola]|uniref:phage portal protein n=1 Tax=Flavobacterium algicola TaxID=556529 RepID=UPI001EFD912C|nr:phage portal protein [Flavobacterium algicola]MCG9792491.1 phage portal protein [Flavobacterium algicola]
MSLNGAFSDMFASQKRSASRDGSYMGGLGGLFSFGNGGNSSVNYKKSLTLTAVYNAVDQISNDIAKIPFSVNKKVGSNRESQPNHPAHRLVSFAPNGLMTTFIFRKTMGMSLLLRGNALARIVNNSVGQPIETIFINWEKVQDIRKKNGDLLYYIQGYDQPLLSSEVLHFKNFSHDGIVGMGAITYGAQQLGLAIEVQTFSATNFANKGVRQGVISTEKTVDKGKDKIIEGWKKAMGEKSPDRVVVLDDGFKFQPINITPQEMQIIETQAFSIEEIARMFNIAPHKIKSLKQSTNNNIEQQTLDHASDTIQPHITNFEQEYAKKLFTSKELESGYYIRGNMNVLLRADIKSRAQWISAMVYCGVMSRNEARQYEDMNDGPELLNEFLTPTNEWTEKQIANQINPPKDGN